jgi:hypothetical protein
MNMWVVVNIVNEVLSTRNKLVINIKLNESKLYMIKF